jgi:hypothetical protein
VEKKIGGSDYFFLNKRHRPSGRKPSLTCAFVLVGTSATPRHAELFCEGFGFGFRVGKSTAGAVRSFGGGPQRFAFGRVVGAGAKVELAGVLATGVHVCGWGNGWQNGRGTRNNDGAPEQRRGTRTTTGEEEGY